MNVLSLQDYLEANQIDLIDSAYDVMQTSYGVDTDTIATFKDKPSKAIWATYRYQLLNCCGCGTYVDRWKYRFADRAYNLMEKYALLFKAYEALKTAGSMTAIESTSKVVTKNEGTAHSETETDNTVTTENIPQYADAQSGEWLNGRNKDKGTVGTDGKTSDSGTIETASALGMLPAELAEKMKNALFNPYVEYAREFEDLFVAFYASGCGCP